MKTLVRNTGSFQLFIVPLIILALGVIHQINMHAFFMYWSDPGYAYLFNGLNFACFDHHVGHLDHPGTPLQILCAAVIRFHYLFSGSGGIPEDVIAHPESYLTSISWVMMLLITTVTAWSGFYLYRRNRSIGDAVLIQATPLLSYVCIRFVPVVACEGLLISALLLMAAISYTYVYYGEGLKKNRIAVIFGFLT
jgi:hypothetical protein